MFLTLRCTRLRPSFSSMTRIALISLLTFSGSATAFETLTPAQSLIYDKSHLSNTSAGQEITYRYRNLSPSNEIINDRVLLSIKKTHDGEKRDVGLDFLSAERHMAFPDFTAFRGNPVIIAMLEHIAQGFGRETGGGVLYFRNRIRDALAKEDIKIEQVNVKYSGRQVAATRLLFSPFVDDVYLVEKPEYTKAIFTITLSDVVPGGVVGIAVESAQSGSSSIEREIIIESLQEN